MSDRKIDKDCSSMFPFKKVIWKYSVPLESRRRKPEFQWQEMGILKEFQDAVRAEHGLHGMSEMSVERHKGAP